MDIKGMAQAARQAALHLQATTIEERNQLLQSLYDSLVDAKDRVLEANLQDVANNTNESLEKRLMLTSDKFDAMSQGILDIIAMPDPLDTIWCKQMDEGLDLYKVSAPIGVLLVIFEARPEVVIQIASLCIKSGNACILKGGKESLLTVKCLESLIHTRFTAVNPVFFAHTREDIAQLLHLDEIDLIIPRGSKSLVQYIQKTSSRPVLGHADGINAIFVDASADVTKTCHAVVDAKCDYPAACNAVETVLIHKEWPRDNVLALCKALKTNGVDIRADKNCGLDEPLATEADFDTEFLDLTIAMKCVDSMDEAIAHIATHSSRHTDCIMTENEDNAKAFLRRVDAAGVYWNCSTRFADGFRYGFGAEIGVSTNKIHARGPVGLEGLLIYKYILKGQGQGAGDYKSKPFQHKMVNKRFE